MREDSGTFGVVLGCLGSSDLADMDKIAPFKVVHATLTDFQTSKYVENSCFFGPAGSPCCKDSLEMPTIQFG